jgi:hypothetical protein
MKDLTTTKKIENLIEAYQSQDYMVMNKMFKAIPANEKHKVNDFMSERYSQYFVNKFSECLYRYCDRLSNES